MSTYHAELASHREEMFRLVERYYQSGLTRRQFSQQEGISLSKLGYWIGRYRRHHQENPAEEAPAQFISLHPMAESEGCGHPKTLLVELCLGNGMILRIYGSVGPCLP